MSFTKTGKFEISYVNEVFYDYPVLTVMGTKFSQEFINVVVQDYSNNSNIIEWSEDICIVTFF